MNRLTKRDVKKTKYEIESRLKKKNCLLYGSKVRTIKGKEKRKELKKMQRKREKEQTK